MDLYVKRFTVRYEGKDYGPGKVIYNMPDELAAELVKESNGTIELLPKQENSNSPGDGDNTGEDSSGSLPSVNPGATVK